MIHRLQQFLVLLFIVVLAYAVTIRAVTSWAQASPNQLVFLIESLTSADIHYQTLDVQQTWMGFEFQAEQFSYSSQNTQLQIANISADINLYAPFIFSLSYGDRLSLSGGKLSITPSLDEKKTQAIDFSKWLKRFNVNALWDKIEVNQFGITLNAPEKPSLFIDSFHSFNGLLWEMATGIKVSSQNIEVANIQAKASLSKNLVGKITAGKYVLSFLSATKIESVKTLIPKTWWPRLPSGDIMLGIEGEIYPDKPALLSAEVVLQNLAWQKQTPFLPSSAGFSFEWTPNLRSENPLLSDWSFRLSKIRFDSHYIQMPSPVIVSMADNRKISFTASNVTIDAFKPLINNSLQHYPIDGIEDSMIANADLDIRHINGDIDIQKARLDHLSLDIASLKWPQSSKLPGLVVSDLEIEKKGNRLSAISDKPIKIHFDEWRQNPVALKFDKEWVLEIDSVENTNLKKINIEQLAFWLEAAKVKLFGSLVTNQVVDLGFEVKARVLDNIKKLLPYPLMSQDLQAWLKKGLVAGKNINGSGVLRGDLNQFPFKKGGGELTASATLDQTVLNPGHGWPLLEDFKAKLLFTPYNLKIISPSAKMLDFSVKEVVVDINNLDSKNIAVQVQGKTTAPSQSALNFLTVSPLAKNLGIEAFIKQDVKATGKVSIDLRKIWIPVYGYSKRQEEVFGKVALNDNVFDFFDGAIEIDSINGELTFTEANLSAKKIKGRFKGEPLEAKIATLHKQVQIGLNGVWSSGLEGALSGNLGWLGQLNFSLNGQAKMSGQLSMDLSQLRSQLPLPFNDNYFARKATKLTLSARLEKAAVLSFNGRLAKEAEFDGQFDFANKRFVYLNGWAGKPKKYTQKNRIQLSGHFNFLNVEDWLNFYNSQPKQESSNPLMEVWRNQNWIIANLSFNKVVAYGNDLNQLALGWESNRENNDNIISVKNPDKLDILLHKTDSKPWQVQLNYLNITIPEQGTTQDLGRSQGTQESCKTGWQSHLPSFDFHGKNIQIDQYKIDDLSFNGIETQNNYSLKDIRAELAQNQINISSQYKFDKQKIESKLVLNLKSQDAESLIKMLELPKGFRGGATKIDLDLYWQGELQCFSKHIAKGPLSISVADGIIKNADPGIARILGLLSVESLARRLKLDLTDFTDEGLVYDSIDGKGELNSGMVDIKSFKLKAPSAEVDMFGKVDLIGSNIDVDVRITPAIGGTLPVVAAATGIATPVAGLAAYLLMKVVPSINEDLVTYRYEVSGSLDAPVIKDTGAGLELIKKEKVEENQYDILNE